jgi:hypothetical protein
MLLKQQMGETYRARIYKTAVVAKLSFKFNFFLI